MYLLILKDILYTFPEDLTTESGGPFGQEKLKPKILRSVILIKHSQKVFIVKLVNHFLCLNGQMKLMINL